MQRLLPILLLFLTACYNDPLAVEIIDFKNTTADDGMATLDPAAPTLLTEHEDLTLRFSFRADAGAKGRLMVRGIYGLDLPSLTISGLEPETPVNLSPGIWHDLELQFKAKTPSSPALLVALYLNGSPVFYQEQLPGNNAEPGPLKLIVDEGIIELADMSYSTVAGRTSTINDDGLVELNAPLLRYEYFHLPEGSRDFAGWDTESPVKTGFINRVDLYGINERGTNYAVRFTGTVNVPEAGQYYFFTWGSGKTDFLIDGKPVAGHAGAPNDWQQADSLQLSAGNHEIDLRIVQHHGWNVNRISYRKAGTDEPLRFLNAMEERVAIATPATPTPRELKPEDEPYLLRSFLYFPAPKLYEAAEKRTHVVSVGEGDGPHYSVDLRTGALLQVWRGKFADVHEMWDGRGEPQVMRPLGPAIQFDGAPLVGPSAKDRWPTAGEAVTDDINEGFRHVAYELDDDGRPAFIYNVDGHSITDQIIPDGTGIMREITHNTGGNAVYYVQLAAARSITETAPGEFVLRGPGLKLRIDGYDGYGLTIQRSGGLERLIAEMAGKGFIRYRMDW